MGFHPIRWLLEPSPPGLGIEFRNREVVVVRFAERRGQMEMDLCFKAPIPSDIVDFSMLEPNIKEPENLERFLNQLFDQAGVNRQRIALTLPDTLASVSLTDLSETPRSRKETVELLRFHLRKSLPFGIESARVAFDPVRGGSPSFLTGVMHEEVISQYEALLGGLGFHVGSVETSALSHHNLWHPVAAKELPSDADYFFLNIEESYFTVVLMRRGAPVLTRTLGQRDPTAIGEPIGRYQLDEMLDEIVPTLIFYREKLGGTIPARVYYRTLRQDLNGLADELQTQFDSPVEPFDLRRAVTIANHLNVDELLAAGVSVAAGAARGKA
jgi:Tfp pilus assembly PilM family ATPase